MSNFCRSEKDDQALLEFETLERQVLAEALDDVETRYLSGTNSEKPDLLSPNITPATPFPTPTPRSLPDFSVGSPNGDVFAQMDRNPSPDPIVQRSRRYVCASPDRTYPP